MAYYVMVGEGRYPVMPIARGPDFEGNWRLGTPITDPVQAKIFQIMPIAVLE